MLLGNIEVKVGAGWGSEGIIAAALQTQEMSEALLRKQLGRVEDCVLEQMGQTWAMNVIMIQMVPAYYSLYYSEQLYHTQEMRWVQKVTNFYLESTGTCGGFAVLYQKNLQRLWIKSFGKLTLHENFVKSQVTKRESPFTLWLLIKLSPKFRELTVLL